MAKTTETASAPPRPVQLVGSGLERDVRHCTNGSCFQVLIARYLWATTQHRVTASVSGMMAKEPGKERSSSHL